MESAGEVFDVYCGVDVGKGEHHAVGLDREGRRLFDKPLPAFRQVIWPQSQ